MLQEDHLQSTVGFPAPQETAWGEFVDFALGLSER